MNGRRERNTFLGQVTPVVLTFNEAPNIGRSLERLRDFSEVLVIDSGSTDETLNIVATFSNARIVHRPFDSFSGQWNFALRECGVETEWLLALDADYLLGDDILDELAELDPPDNVVAYRIAFDYAVFGRKLSSTLYPPLLALYRHAQVSYVQDGHCMRAQFTGDSGELRHRIVHDDRKPLSRWLASQAKYADQEAELLLQRNFSDLRVQDKLRRMMVITPWLVPLYVLIIGRAFFDGWPGWYYALHRGIAEAVLALRLMELHLAEKE